MITFSNKKCSSSKTNNIKNIDKSSDTNKNANVTIRHKKPNKKTNINNSNNNNNNNNSNHNNNNNNNNNNSSNKNSATKLNFRRPQSRKLFSGRFIKAAHLAHASIIAEQNDLQRVLYPLSVLAAPSTDRLTFIV